MAPIVIIGAGPAGLTAGLELLRAGHPAVTLLEATDAIGGISKTVNYKGNRIDIGGHRFFSKSDWVMDWWRGMLPVARPEGAGGGDTHLAYQGQQRLLGAQQATASEADDAVMLVRSRQSRIYFGGNFFDYPLKPGLDLVRKMGVARCMQFAGSYMAAAASPIRPERTLEDFFINRFGRQLYRQFFKDYTEKVWGVPCRDISADWGGAAHQEPVHRQRSPAGVQEDRHRQDRHPAHLPDRELPLPQVRPRPDVGGRSRRVRAAWRPAAARLGG